MIRRNVNIICVQETKWIVGRYKEMKRSVLKIQYVGEDKLSNGVVVIVDNV